MQISKVYVENLRRGIAERGVEIDGLKHELKLAIARIRELEQEVAGKEYARQDAILKFWTEREQYAKLAKETMQERVSNLTNSVAMNSGKP